MMMINVRIVSFLHSCTKGYGHISDTYIIIKTSSNNNRKIKQSLPHQNLETNVRCLAVISTPILTEVVYWSKKLAAITAV